MSPRDKPIVWLHGERTTPPFSQNARIEKPAICFAGSKKAVSCRYRIRGRCRQLVSGATN